MNRVHNPQIEIVVPLYNEIDVVEQLHQRLSAVCQSLTMEYRIVYVDDGSKDGTSEWIQSEITNHRETITLIRLSRNFGQPAAIDAGIRECDNSACVVVMDGDLQDPPELIPEMIAQWQQGAEVVIPQKRSRKDSLIRGLAFRGFHRLFAFLSDSLIPPDTGTFCLMDRRAVEALQCLPESNRFFPGLRAWIGFRQILLPFDRPARAAGDPKQTFRRIGEVCV